MSYRKKTLKNIVPWGRSLKEYIDMFTLTKEDLNKSFLGCGDGPASFNCEMTALNKRVVSFDPIYRFSRYEISQRIDEAYHTIMGQLMENKDKFVWTNIPTPNELGRIRMEAMNMFLSDYEAGKNEGRYIEASLPVLPFKDKQFDIALSSHFLFLYSQQLSFDFHLRSIIEMRRVAKEARIFPLLDISGQRSPYIEFIVFDLRKLGYKVSIIKTRYEFQRGGNEMMKVEIV